MTNRRRLIAGMVGLMLLAVAAALALVTRSEAHELVSHTVRAPIDETPGDLGLPFEDVTVTTVDGLHLVGWYIPPQNGAAIMTQHGYKSDRTSLLDEAAMLHRHGYGVLLMSIRAHDLSAGEQISFGYHEMKDLEAWYQFLLTREEIDPDKIGILGCSMGGSLVIQYAAGNADIKAVVAQSPFSSLDDTVSTSIQKLTSLPPFPFAPLIVFWAEQELGIDSSEINARLWVKEISPRPILLMDGGLDDYVSEDSGELLYAAAGEPKEFWFEPDIGHCEFDEKMPQAFEDRVIAFFDAYLLEE